MPISFTIDPASFAALSRDLADKPGQLKGALKMALNESVQRGRGKYVDAASQILTAKKKWIRKRIVQGKRATREDLSADFKLAGIRIALLRFKVSGGKRRKPLIAEFIRGQHEIIPGAFIGIGPEGSKHVLTRRGGKRRIARAHYQPNVGRLRQDVATQQGISVSHAYETRPGLWATAEEQVAEILAKRVAHHVDLVTRNIVLKERGR